LELHLFTKFSKKKKWHPYKLHLVQELSEDDLDRCVQLCDVTLEIINDDPLIHDNIVFSDVTFELMENIDRHNCTGAILTLTG